MFDKRRINHYQFQVSIRGLKRETELAFVLQMAPSKDSTALELTAEL